MMEQNQIAFNFEQLLNQFEELHKDPIHLNRNIYECPKCAQHGLLVEDGNIVCQWCGCEYGGVIDNMAEWRNYSMDDHRTSDPSRCGSAINPLLLESSYGTTLGFSRSNYCNHLRQLNSWQSMPYYERSLKLVFDRLSQSASLHGLTSNIIDFSHRLYAEVVQTQNASGETKLSRGDNRDGLIAACLFYACKEYEVSRSPQEIGNICDVETSDVTRGINLFYELMKNSQSINLNQYITKYSDFIERFCNCLEIENDMTKEIVHLAKKVDSLQILTKNTPQAMACGCIYFITTMHNTGLTKTNISDKCGISVPTITKSYERLLPYTQKLI